MVALGAACAFACGILVGVAYALMFMGPRNPYGRWLGMTCWVCPSGRDEWVEHVIVAVSWKGAVCVRRECDETGYWIKKHNVGWRVSFDRPVGDAK